MKQTVQQQKRKAPAPAMQKPRNTTHLRPGIVNQSNHSRLANDKWERQADDAAFRIIRGESGVAGILTPTAAASKRVPDSRGEMLPIRLREEIEHGFGADFRSVRIHRDAASASAARLSKSKAFTSGVHVYFGASRFKPDNADGRLLLLHELAHVLQQTGRRNSLGILSATDIRGPGSIQAEDIGQGHYVSKNASGFKIDFDEVKTRHKVSDDLKFIHYAQKIETALTPAGAIKADFSNKDSVKALDKFVVRNGFPRKSVHRAFLYDCLKLSGNANRALWLIKSHPYTKTRYWMQGMGKYSKVTVGKDWALYTRIIKSDKRLIALWTFLIDTFRQMVIAPYRDVQTVRVKNVGTIEEVLNKITALGTIGSFEKSNELAWAAASIMLSIDESRMSMTRDFYKDFRRFNAPSINRTFFMALQVEKLAIAISKNKLAVISETGRLVFDIAHKAVVFWKKYYGIRRFTFESLADAKKGSVRLSSHSHFTQLLPEKILASAKRLSALGKKQSFPSRYQYFTRRNQAIWTIRDFSRNVLQMRFLAIMRSKKPDEHLALAYVWAMRWIEKYIAQLEKYDVAKDKAFEDKYARNDLRFAHRYRTAIFLGHYLNIFADMGLKGGRSKGQKKNNWQELRRYIEPILKHVDQGASQVALLDDWVLDTRAGIGKITGDFKKPLDNLKPLTVTQTANLYIALYHGGVTRKIEELLEAARKDDLSDPYKSIAKDPILKESLATVARPQRWTLKDRVVKLSPKDAQWKPSNKDRYDPVMKLVIRHPKTVDLHNREKSRKISHTLIYPHFYDTSRKPSLFVWSLPPIDNIVRLLRESKQKNDLNQYVALIAKKNIDEVEALGWSKWLAYFVSGKSIKGKNGILDPSALLQQAVSGTFASKKKGLSKAMRELSTYERRILASRVSAILKKFDRDDITTFSIPNRVLSAIEDFSWFIVPPRERYWQMAALMFSIARELNTGLGAKHDSMLFIFKFKRGAVARYDVLNGFLSHLIAAKAYSKGVHRKKLLGLLNDKEKAELSSQEDSLDKLLRAMKAQRRKQQSRIGFSAKKSTQTVKSYNFTTEIKAGKDAFKDSGVEYRILRVYRDFDFIPSYGKGGSLAESILKISGKPVRRRTGRKLLRIQFNNGEAYDLKDTDEGILTRLQQVISQRAFVLSLENTGRIIEGFTEGLMDIAELIPGYGQAIMAARIVTGVLQFLLSDEYDAIKGLLSGDVEDLIKQIQKQLDEMFTVEGVVELLIFGNPSLSRISDLGGVKKSRRGARISGRTKKSKIGKVFKVAMGLGKGIAHGLEQLETRVQKPVRGIQSYVVTRPNLSFVLLLIARHAQALENLPDSPDDIKNRVRDSAGDFTRQLEEILVAMQTLKLPEEIVPMKIVAEFLVSMLLDRMGSKVRAFKNIIVWPLLRTTGSLDYLFGEIENSIKGTKIDPNVEWQKFVAANIDEQLRKAAQDIADQVVGKLNQVSGNAFGSVPQIAAVKSANEKNFDDPDLQLPKSELFRSSQVHEQSSPNSDNYPAGAKPLPSSLRVDIEKRFGHDFSHVRILIGGEADELTRSLGAEGLTSGSYIYLRSSVGLTGSKGSPVLDHELVHVLQQLGPRPLGRHHDNQPRFARQKGGVSYDSSHESEASRIAREVKDRDEPGAVTIQGHNSQGLQPLFTTQLLRKMLRNFASFGEIIELVEMIDKESIKRLKTNTKPYKYAETIWEAVKLKMAGLDKSPSVLPVYLRESAAEVTADFKNRVSAKITVRQLRKLAAFAIVNKVKKGAGGKKTTDRVFNANRFSRFLEAVVLVKGGISISIDLKRSYKSKMSKNQSVSKAADAAKIIDKLSVKGIYMPAIGGTAKLWTNAMAAFGSADKAAHQTRAREVLRPFGPAAKIPGTDGKNRPVMITVFKAKSPRLTFSAEFVAYIKRLQMGVSTLKAEDLTRIKDYVKYDGPSPAGTVGLRVGKYGDHPGTHKDRQSHHTTQLLLVDYFRNDSYPKPFKSSREYPGLKFNKSKGKAKYLRSDKGPDVQFERLASGTRGNEMPAILVATRTHQKGRLHIKATTSDDANRSSRRAKQGETIDNKYQNYFSTALGSYGIKTAYLSNEKKSDAEFNAYIQSLNNPQENKIANSMYDAMQHTYKWMHGIMLPALNTALVQVEVPYYREMASKVSSRRKGADDLIEDFDMKAKDVAPVYKDAVRNNDAVMRGQGWIAS